MNQRVAIALAMMSHPDLLLADEPTSALDNLLSQQVVMGLKALVQENHTSMIIVSHSLKVLVRLADELMILHDGKCIEYGKTETLLYFPCHPFTRQLIEAWKWSEWHETDAGH
ncbi:Glutathione import ATP-binding protein GsiA [Clostridiales bacterium CHKCI006]|nr:Glutathione import ATP-binding protein GsiA [Clostridiales bacterium CHKCI006]